MHHAVHYNSCPVCHSTSLKEVMMVEDASVSKEKFSIMECGDCSFRFTDKAPCETAVGRYYQSADYVSHSDSRKGLINTLYHLARKYTIGSKVSFVKKVTGRAVGMHLDVGSGTGSFVHAMEKAGWSSTGLEPDSNAREIAAKKYKADVFPAEDFFTLPESTYDVITMWHVLEHVHRLDDYLVQLKKLLNPNGKLIVAVPNYKSRDAQTYGANWAAYDVPRHLYHFSPSSMRKLMERHGLKVKQTKPMWLDSFYVSMLSEKYKKGNFIRAIWNGFVSNLITFFHREQCSSLIYVMAKK
ncbi:MAG: class I SAM-dependent methyltransferase [Chitinophagaceae bacterium]|nr:class I SAM-dependent methyltransferase [Chitinophagaceae bacterium]